MCLSRVGWIVQFGCGFSGFPVSMTRDVPSLSETGWVPHDGAGQTGDEIAPAVMKFLVRTCGRAARASPVFTEEAETDASKDNPPEQTMGSGDRRVLDIHSAIHDIRPPARFIETLPAIRRPRNASPELSVGSVKAPGKLILSISNRVMPSRREPAVTSTSRGHLRHMGSRTSARIRSAVCRTRPSGDPSCIRKGWLIGCGARRGAGVRHDPPVRSRARSGVRSWLPLKTRPTHVPDGFAVAQADRLSAQPTLASPVSSFIHCRCLGRSLSCRSVLCRCVFNRVRRVE